MIEVKKINELAKRIHVNAVKHGWWEEPTPSQGHYFCLVVCELAEAVEAERKGKHANLDTFNSLTNAFKRSSPDNKISYTRWKGLFEMNVKDTVEDELADTYIRLLDIAGSMGMVFVEEEFNWCPLCQLSYSFTENVNLLMNYVSEMGILSREPTTIEMARLIMQVNYFTKDVLGFDLLTFVQMKIKYNTKRPYKHGKQF